MNPLIFGPEDLDRDGLTNRHRAAMLDCILAWARLESAFRATLSVVEGRALYEGAGLYDQLNLSLGWRKLRQAARNGGAPAQVLSNIRKLGRECVSQAGARNIIAHAGCLGVSRAHPEFILFAPFASSAAGELDLVAMPLAQIDRSITWADQVREQTKPILAAAGL